jgi:hypothetical protein
LTINIPKYRQYFTLLLGTSKLFSGDVKTSKYNKTYSQEYPEISSSKEPTTFPEVSGTTYLPEGTPPVAERLRIITFTEDP